MSIPDGGPAFPSTDYCDEKPIGSSGGMSLRDYFAAHAIIGCGRWPGVGVGQDFTHAAAFAYSIADAMLKERAKAEKDA